VNHATIEVTADSGVATLTFSRPQVLNAFDPTLIGETRAAMAELGADPSVRAIVVRGAGRAFSAGFDLKVALTRPPLDADGWRQALTEDFAFIMDFWDCPKPTIACVHGHCVGGAFELALACDVTLAGEGARFGAPEVRFGSGAVALLLPWVAGPKAAKELLLSGETHLTAARAQALGIVNHVVPDADVYDRALALARDMAAAAPAAVQFTKQAINRSYEAMGLRSALLQALETDIFIEAAAGPERREFNRIRAEQGLQAALAWRDSKARRQGGGH
jgi:enoyl-CoA hydratase